MEVKSTNLTCADAISVACVHVQYRVSCLRGSLALQGSNGVASNGAHGVEVQA